MIPIMDLKRQYRALKAEIDAAVHEVLDSGWFVLGKQVEAFEKEFAEYCGVRFAVGVGSGVEAIHLALTACGVGPGDEVITVPNTAVPTALGISFAGARPTFADIEPDTYLMDPKRVEAAITRRTKAIMPVHLYGQVAPMSPLREIAAKHGLLLIEDAAQAHGATYQGKKAGGLGHVGCFSFYPSKNLGCFGEGGAPGAKQTAPSSRPATAEIICRLMREKARASAGTANKTECRNRAIRPPLPERRPVALSASSGQNRGMPCRHTSRRRG